MLQNLHEPCKGLSDSKTLLLAVRLATRPQGGYVYEVAHGCVVLGLKSLRVGYCFFFLSWLGQSYLKNYLEKQDTWNPNFKAQLTVPASELHNYVQYNIFIYRIFQAQN